MCIIEKAFKYGETELSVIKCKDDIWFRGKTLAEGLGYSNLLKAIRTHIDSEDKEEMLELLYKGGAQNGHPFRNVQRETIYVNESGLYSLVLQSKLPFAREFKRWIVKDVLPNIRKNGNYCLSNVKQCFSRQLCFKIMDERDLHIKVISYIRNNHPNAILCAGLGELQDSSTK